MSGKGLFVAMLAVATILAVSAAGQDEKNEVGGLLGRTFVSDQGIQGATFSDSIIHSGKGLTIWGQYARRFWVAPVYSTSAERLFTYNWDMDLNARGSGHSVVPADHKNLFITAAARVNLFPTTAVSPRISLGAGLGHVSQNDQLIYGGMNPGKSMTSAVIEAGMGLDVKFWRKLSMRGGCQGLVGRPT